MSHGPSFLSFLTSLLLTVSLALTSPATAQQSDNLVFPSTTWQTASPESQGIDPENLEHAIEHIQRIVGEHGISEVVIVKNGYVIWQGDNVTNRHLIWSCTKSFMSTTLGLLWDDGLLTPSDLAADHYPPLEKWYPTVTLENLATFTSGYAESGSRLNPGPSRYQPGAAFHYSGESDMLAAILTKIAGRSLEDLFSERIATPIGITHEAMDWGEQEAPDSPVAINGGSGGPPSGVHINALAMARFGWLMANEGVWDGKRLLSQRYVDYATVPRTSPDLPPFDPKGWYVDLPGNYGLNWWTNGPRPSGKPHWPSAPAHTFAAQGNKDNVCFIVPEWKLVVVRLGLDKIIDMAEYDPVFKLLDPTIQASAQPRQ